MTREHRHIDECIVDLDLQPWGGDIEDRYKAVVCVGPQSLVWIAGVIVHKIQKRCACSRRVAARGTLPECRWNA